jgi:hypothetical protein
MPMQNVLGADLWLAWLKDNSSAAPRDLAQKIAEKVSTAAANKQKTAHYAMIDLSKMNDLGAKIGQLGNVLVTEATEHWDEVVHAWGQTHVTQYDNPGYVDLREFTNKLQAEPTLSTINLINTAASDVRNLLNSDGAVPYTNVNVAQGDPNVPRGGLCIHFPPSLELFDSSNYVTLAFRATNWHAFLSTFLRSAGGTDPVGRCCYNNNQDCGVGTQAECAGVNGQWTQGIDCNTPCTTTGGCPTTCATAAAITLGQPVTTCQLAAPGAENWFTMTLNVGVYRFQLGDFSAGADFDLFTYQQCADYPGSPTSCSGEAEGPEDFTCTITGAPVLVYFRVLDYDGAGSYTLLISLEGETMDAGNDFNKKGKESTKLSQ